MAFPARMHLSPDGVDLAEQAFGGGREGGRDRGRGGCRQTDREGERAGRLAFHQQIPAQHSYCRFRARRINAEIQ